MRSLVLAVSLSLLAAVTAASAAHACPGDKAAVGGKPVQCPRLKAGLPCNCGAKQTKATPATATAATAAAGTAPAAAGTAMAVTVAKGPAKAPAGQRAAAAAAAATGATAPVAGEVPIAFAKPPAPGSKVRCSVTGDVFTVGEKTPTSTYQGKVYAFCCPSCKPRFDKSPASYAKR